MWWLLWILPAIILFILIYLFIAPFYLELNSRTGICRFRLSQLAEARILMHNDSIFLRYKIAWWKREMDLLAPPKNKKQIPGASKPKKEKKSLKMKRMPQRITAVLKSFRVLICDIRIDTGNYQVNGILYPWFYLFSANSGKSVMINFWGENEIILTIKNSMARIGWKFLTAK